MPDTRSQPNGEVDIIQHFFVPLTAKAPPSLQALGLQDDCALLTPQPGYDLVITTDGLIEGVHFLPGTAPASIGWKAIAVNASDLIAKGASPRAYTMNLALPDRPPDPWLQGLVDGLDKAQQTYGCHLIGGDTDRTIGSLAISITAIGELPAGQMVRRSTAKPGDLVYVSGTIGDAALGLMIASQASEQTGWDLSPADKKAIITAHTMPAPALELAPELRRWASAAIDVSDGLIKDFTSLCRASRVTGKLELAHMPVSAAAEKLLARGLTSHDQLATGGEDYQVLFTIPAAKRDDFEQHALKVQLPVRKIGKIGDILPAGRAEPEVQILDKNGHSLDITQPGWDHFATLK